MLRGYWRLFNIGLIFVVIFWKVVEISVLWFELYFGYFDDVLKFFVYCGVFFFY